MEPVIYSWNTKYVHHDSSPVNFVYWDGQPDTEKCATLRENGFWDMRECMEWWPYICSKSKCTFLNIFIYLGPFAWDQMYNYDWCYVSPSGRSGVEIQRRMVLSLWQSNWSWHLEQKDVSHPVPQDCISDLMVAFQIMEGSKWIVTLDINQITLQRHLVSR